jgi:hypothetical protein
VRNGHVGWSERLGYSVAVSYNESAISIALLKLHKRMGETWSPYMLHDAPNEQMITDLAASEFSRSAGPTWP